MGVNFKAQLRSAITNAAYLIKNAPDIMLYKLGLNDSELANDSGSPIDNTQKFINQIADSSGETEGDANRKVYSSNLVITDGDSKKVALGKLDLQVGSNVTDISDITSSIGQPNGIAPLDASSRVPLVNLPSGLFTYKGTYNASTNTPTLIDGTGTPGDSYRVSVAGTQDFGSGSITFSVDDKVVYNTDLIWEKWDTSDEVSSVFGRTGDIIAQSGDYIASDVGLGNVTNDSQLKREAADFNSFTEKVTPVIDDIILIENSESGYTKAKVKMSNLLGGGGGGGGGGLETYYTQDFESFLIGDLDSSGNDATFNNGGTIDGVVSIDTSTPLDKLQSLRYTAGTSSNNDWVVIDTQEVYELQRSRENAMLIEIDATNFSTNFDLNIYDETNSAILETYTVIGGTSLRQYSIPFSYAATTSLVSYGFHFNDTPVDTEYVIFDNVELTTDVFKTLNINNENVFAARVTAAPAITSQTGDFIDSVSLTGSDMTITYKAGLFTEIPSVVVTMETEPDSSTKTIGIANSTTSLVTFSISQIGVGPVQVPINIVVTKQGADYAATTSHVVTPAKNSASDEIEAGLIDIDAVTTAPTKGATTVDRVTWHREGQFAVIRYTYEQSAAGSSGSGEYLFGIPSEIGEVDTSLVSPHTGAASSISTGKAYIGDATIFITSGPQALEMKAYLYNSTQFRLIRQTSGQVVNSSFYQLGIVPSYSIVIKVPIVGWSSYSQFLAAIPPKNYAEIRHHGAKTIPSGVSNISFSGTQGESYGISLVNSGAEVKFTKKGSYVITIDYRQANDIWTKWGLRTLDTTSIVGESSFGGGSVVTSKTFVAKISDLSQTYRFFISVNGATSIAAPSPVAGNIGDSDTTIIATIREI